MLLRSALLTLGVVRGRDAGCGIGALWLAHNLLGAALMTHVLFVIAAGWRDDLVEARRRLRGPILAAAALYAVAVIAVQISEILWRPADVLSPIAAAALLILSLAAIGTLLQADPELFARPSQAAASRGVLSNMPAPSGEDARIVGKLDRLMRGERTYREENLSIAALAVRGAFPSTSCGA